MVRTGLEMQSLSLSASRTSVDRQRAPTYDRNWQFYRPGRETERKCAFIQLVPASGHSTVRFRSSFRHSKRCRLPRSGKCWKQSPLSSALVSCRQVSLTSAAAPVHAFRLRESDQAKSAKTLEKKAPRTSVQVPATNLRQESGMRWSAIKPWLQQRRAYLAAHPRATAMLSVSLLLLTVLLMRMVRKRRNAFLIQKRRALGLDSLVPAGPGGRSQSNDAAKMDEAALPQRIAQFYDTQSELWERVWGEHMHHGFYGLDGSQTEKDDRQAQVDMMDELLVFSGVDAMLRAAVGIGNQRIRVLDVGCGIGGASRHIATRYGANVHVTGITLSPVQASRAQVLTRQLRLEDRVETMVANALHLPFPDNSFDVVWSMESAEHMPNKLRFMQECARVLRPSGRLAMTAWCHRACPPPFGNVDRQIYRKVCEQYCIPYLCALNEFENYAWQNGLIQVRTADWTRATLPFWPAVARSAFRRRALVGLLEGGWPLIRAALAVRWMIQGFRRGIFVIGALSAEKPASS